MAKGLPLKKKTRFLEPLNILLEAFKERGREFYINYSSSELQTILGTIVRSFNLKQILRGFFNKMQVENEQLR